MKRDKRNLDRSQRDTHFGNWYSERLAMRRRIAAKLLDVLFILLLAGLALVVAAFLARPLHSPEDPENTISFREPLWLLLIPVIVVVIPLGYETAFVALCGATPGKRFFRLRIVRESGTPMTWLHSFARAAAQILSGTIAALGYLMAFVDWDQKTLHDRLCGTVVIGAAKEFTNSPATTVDRHNNNVCPMCGAQPGLAENCQSCGEKLPAPIRLFL